MAFEVLLVFLAMLMVTETERAKHLPTKRRLCLCADRVLPLQSFPEDKESAFISCEQWCSTNDLSGMMSHGPSSHLRTRRDDVQQFTNCPAGLDRIDEKWHIKKENIRAHFYDIEGSSKWLVEVSWSPFEGGTKGWDNYYMRYFTGENRIYQNYSCLMLPKNRTSVNITSSFQPRKITLTVTALPNPKDIPSGGMPNLVLEPFTPPQMRSPLEYTPAVVSVHLTLKPTSERENLIVTYVSIAVGSLVGIIFAVCLLKYLCRRKTSIPLPTDFKFHAFIIYNKEDERWVKEKLLKFLEGEHGLRVCIHYRDFTPGIPFTKSMADSVYLSHKIIAVYSSNFLQSKYCDYELELAKYRLLNKRDNCLIVIRIDNSEFKDLPPELRGRSCIDYADRTERQFWKSRLVKFLDVPKEPSHGEVEVEADPDSNAFTPGVTTEGPHRRTESRFLRLDSSISTSTELSIVTLNEENPV